MRMQAIDEPILALIIKAFIIENHNFGEGERNDATGLLHD